MTPQHRPGAGADVRKPSRSRVLVASMLVFLASCGGEGTHLAEAHTGGPTAHAGSPATGPSLDDGRKWKANEATHAGMAEMEKLLDDFEASGARNHRALGESLRARTDVILEECTMSGEPHHQLHLLLAPMLRSIDALVSGRGRDEEVRTLRKHLQDYFAHFDR